MRLGRIIAAAALAVQTGLAAQDVTELTVWNRPAENAPAERAIFDRSVGDFEAAWAAAHGGSRIKVKALSRRYIPQQFVSVMAGGKGPDVAHIGVGGLRTLARLGVLAPMDAEVASWPRKAFLPPVLLEPAQLDGRLYGVPCDSYFQCLLIRTDLFRAAGLDPANPPADWAALREAAVRLTRPEAGQAGLGFSPTTGSFLDFLWQAGGEVLRNGPDGRPVCAFHENAGVSALSYLRELRFGAKVMQPNPLASQDEISQLFALGRLGMMVGVPNQLPDLILRYGMDPRTVAIAPLPAGPTGVRASHAGGDYYVINAQAPADRKAAAWAFVQHMLAPETQLAKWRAMTGQRMPIFPGAFSVDVQIEDPSLAMARAALPSLRVEPHAENWPQIKDQIDTLVLERAMTDPAADLPALLMAASEGIQSSLLDARP